jgi:CBS-domain-containing membrane protein
MTLCARDIMVREIETIDPNASVEDAIYKISNGVVRDTGYKTVSLMVVDGMQRLCGVVTMFDLLYHLRPDYLNFGIDSRQLKWEGQLDLLIGNVRGKRVHQIMTANVVSVSADDHIMVLLDRMVKKKYRRLPVLECDRLVGVVYLSDVYHHLLACHTEHRHMPRMASACH